MDYPGRVEDKVDPDYYVGGGNTPSEICNSLNRSANQRDGEGLAQ